MADTDVPVVQPSVQKVDVELLEEDMELASACSANDEKDSDMEDNTTIHPHKMSSLKRRKPRQRSRLRLKQSHQKQTEKRRHLEKGIQSIFC